MNQVIIVGAGAAGVAAALGFRGSEIKPLILDLGNEPENVPKIDQNLYEYRKDHDLYPIMVGGDNFGLNNIIYNEIYPPKVLLPLNKYITRNSQLHSPLQENGFKVLQSFAAGGLANGWGAGLYRYQDEELKGLPVSAADLDPYFDRLTDEIGMSGENDDLTRFFGDHGSLQRPLRLSQKAESLYRNYLNKKVKLNSKGIYIGHPRLAVLSQKYSGRPPCDYTNFETWIPDLPYIYTPKMSLKNMIRDGQADYRKEVLVRYWKRDGDLIEVVANDVLNKKEITFSTKKLIIAAGPVNSARIVLRSRNDFDTRLNLLDNPLLQIPVILLGFIGKKLDKSAFGMTNLNLIYKVPGDGTLLQGSLIELTSPPRSYLNQQFPFSSSMSLRLTKYFSPALMALFLYFPSQAKNTSFLRLKNDNVLEVKSDSYVVDMNKIKPVFTALRKIGGWSHPLLARLSPPGYAIHYAGTLPMVKDPSQKYQCSVEGELFNEPGVYIADASLFSFVAAKNISFTVMANAMRIADLITRAG